MNRVVGVLGGGQLGRMLGLAGLPMGLDLRFLDPAAEVPAAAVGTVIQAAWDDAAAQARFADGCDVVTWEFENVPLACARAVAAHTRLTPPIEALAVKQDRLSEKRFLHELGIATAPFAEVSSQDELETAAARLGLPAVLKTRRDGYDGKGQRVLRRPGELAGAFAALGNRPCILEGFIDFARECSLLAVRGRDGEIRSWPLVENEHRGGILHRSLAPAPHGWAVQGQAEAAARALLEKLAYVGVLCIEFFQDGDRLLANEFAPRVHNSGHWTIEGSATSQFENHLRAVCGLPLGPTSARGHATMINLIGAIPPPARLLAIPGAHLHLYGKQPRPGRKVGHVTLVDDDARRLAELVARVEDVVAGAAAAHA